MSGKYNNYLKLRNKKKKTIQLEHGQYWQNSWKEISPKNINIWPIITLKMFSILSHCCSVTKWCPTLCDPMACSTLGFPVLHCLLEFAQTHVHWVSDAIQPSHLLSPYSKPPTLNLSHHQGIFQWVSSLHQVAKVLELQHQSFQWIFRVDFL